MSYWQYPTSIDGRVFDWAELNKYTSRPNAYDNVKGKNYIPSKVSTSVPETNFKTQVANLMERIGAHVGMDYGCDGSGASTVDAVQFLQKHGYKYNYSISLGHSPLPTPVALNFNTNTVISSLEQNQPVLIDGYRTKNTFLGITIYYSNGHAWVVDGYISQKQPITIKTELLKKGNVVSVSTSTDYNYTTYLHNNWGWNGSNNGYYISGSFDANNGPDSASNTKSGEPYNYQYDVDIFPFISR
jgi:signal peptidase I